MSSEFGCVYKNRVLGNSLANPMCTVSFLVCWFQMHGLFQEMECLQNLCSSGQTTEQDDKKCEQEHTQQIAHE